MRRVLVIVAAASLASLGLATAASRAALPGDRLIARDRAASDLSGFADHLVWSHRAGRKRHQLRLYRGGRVERVRTPASREEMDADVGPGPDGAPALVYRSCRPNCRIYRYSVTTRRERRLPVRQPRGCEADYPAISGSAVVYALGGDRCGGQREGVWVLSGKRTRRLVPSDAGQMDLRDNQVIWTHFGDIVNRVRSTTLAPGAPVVSLFADGQRCCDSNVIIGNPTFDGDAVYWSDWNEPVFGGKEYHRLFRSSGVSGAPCEASDVEFPSNARSVNGGFPWIDFAVTAGRVSYITAQGIFEHARTSFGSQFSKYTQGSATAPFCGP